MLQYIPDYLALTNHVSKIEAYVFSLIMSNLGVPKTDKCEVLILLDSCCRL